MYPGKKVWVSLDTVNRVLTNLAVENLLSSEDYARKVDALEKEPASPKNEEEIVDMRRRQNEDYNRYEYLNSVRADILERAAVEDELFHIDPDEKGYLHCSRNF